MESYVTTKLSTLRQRVHETKDYLLFDEVVKCLGAGANRSAYIVSWICVAESLRNKFMTMAIRDTEVGKIVGKIRKAEQDERPTDKIILESARDIGIITHDEYTKLDQIRVMRNVYAHPTGNAPSEEEVLAAITVGVETVLGKPPLLRHGYVDNLLDSLFQDYHFLDDVPAQVQGFTKGVANRIHPEVKPYLLKNLIARLEQTFDDPTLSVFRRRNLEFGSILLRIWRLKFPSENWDLIDIMQKYPQASSLLFCDTKLWRLLPLQARNMVFGHLCEPIKDGIIQPPTSVGLQRVNILASANLLTQRQNARIQSLLPNIPYGILRGASIHFEHYAKRIIEDLESHNWYKQNPACDAIKDAGFEECNGLDEAIQMEIGRNILQAADGRANGAENLISELLCNGEQWPKSVIMGLVAESLVNEQGSFRIKRIYFAEALTICCIHPNATEILDELVNMVQKSELKSLRNEPKDCDYVVSAIDNMSKSVHDDTAANLNTLKLIVLDMKKAIEEELESF